MIDTNDTMELLRALVQGEDAARAVAEGGEPDLQKLEHYAVALEATCEGIEKGTICCGWTQPTRQDVDVAFRLVELIRGGAPKDVLKEPAWHVYRVVADPGGLEGIGGDLLWLAGEECEEERSPEHLLYRLDRSGDELVPYGDREASRIARISGETVEKSRASRS